MKKKQIDSMYL